MLSATSMPILSTLRHLRGIPGRVQISPHAAWVASSCIGSVYWLAFFSDFSTYSAPSTSLRTLRPASNSLSLIAFSSLNGRYIGAECFPSLRQRQSHLIACAGGELDRQRRFQGVARFL